MDIILIKEKCCLFGRFIHILPQIHFSPPSIYSWKHRQFFILVCFLKFCRIKWNQRIQMQIFLCWNYLHNKRNIIKNAMTNMEADVLRISYGMKQLTVFKKKITYFTHADECKSSEFQMLIFLSWHPDWSDRIFHISQFFNWLCTRLKSKLGRRIFFTFFLLQVGF